MYPEKIEGVIFLLHQKVHSLDIWPIGHGSSKPHTVGGARHHKKTVEGLH